MKCTYKIIQKDSFDMTVPVFQGETGPPGPTGRRGTRGIAVSKTFYQTLNLRHKMLFYEFYFFLIKCVFVCVMILTGFYW